MRVVRVVVGQRERRILRAAAADADDGCEPNWPADTKIEPGEQKLQVNVAMTFELQ